MIAAVIAVGVRLIAPFPWIFDIDDRDFMPLVLVVPLLGAYALYHAAMGLRWSLRARKFGASVLEIDGGVGRLGRPLEGVVRTARPLRPAGDYRIVLQCIDTHRMQSKSDRTEDRSSVVWARTLTVPAAGVDSSAGIPFSFMLPSAAPEPESVQGAGGLRVDYAVSIPLLQRVWTNRSAVGRTWRLVVSAPVPGTDFEAAFTVPVESA